MNLELREKILKKLSEHAQRCTYTALAEAVGSAPINVMADLPRTPHNSFVVGAGSGRPGGYSHDQISPRFQENARILRSRSELLAWFNGSGQAAADRAQADCAAWSGSGSGSKNHLYIGFDPGGTGKKWAYVCATSKKMGKLLVGVVKDGVRQPVLSADAFPYLDHATVLSIEHGLSAFLTDVVAESGLQLQPAQSPLQCLVAHYESVIVAIDAPSGFACGRENIRDTEQAAGGNYNTPNETRFLADAALWLSSQRLTPLRQRVFWKLVGFAIYRYFVQANSAREVSTGVTAGIAADNTLRLAGRRGLIVLESFPSDVYRNTGEVAFRMVQELATLPLSVSAGMPLSGHEVAVFKEILAEFAVGNRAHWARCHSPVQDTLDAFACMILGMWGMQSCGLRVLGTDLARLRQEGAIIVPYATAE